MRHGSIIFGLAFALGSLSACEGNDSVPDERVPGLQPAPTADEVLSEEAEDINAWRPGTQIAPEDGEEIEEAEPPLVTGPHE